ncbi:acetyl-CoA C-acetyltransferase [Babesia microti strain RI]|uniref:Acetyl-CoA C-acetyltransferase n=1 Tax=Babesia microti (strain RI) TaxID=1133968 RepID=A0A1R4ACE5_BABMR|nr:acetyl-CoA C-acetyltransferase [Babesia microti strain RI]SJK86682.1 acetyl-CoA C-acetyltransferase [Babesia microti strain RI]|eukprot:XP_021338810.1 acetyl-CoA C-acetyltransferase [Babesia microti strain RI]
MTSVIGLCRSPFCATFGHLSTLNSFDLATRVVESAVKRAHIDPKWVKSVFWGQVLPQLQNINCITKGLDDIGLNNCNVTTINSLCNSGLSSIILANKMTNGGLGITVAGGADSLSNAPYLLKNNFNANVNINGEKYNDGVLFNSIKIDYLSEKSSKVNNGMLSDYNITKSDIEKFKVATWKRTLDCLSANILEQEITPFKVKLAPQKHENKVWISQTERIVHRDQLLSDIPEFHKNNENTALLVDGACAIVLASSDVVKKHKLGEITRIVATSECKSDNLESSIKDSLIECLREANLSQSKIDVYELQDQFTYIPLFISKILNIDICRINLHGGSTAIGFCPGASGARLAISLTSVLKSRGLRYGCAVAINRLGQVSTLILENQSYN